MNSKMVRCAPFLVEFFGGMRGAKKGRCRSVEPTPFIPAPAIPGGLLSSRARVCFAG